MIEVFTPETVTWFNNLGLTIGIYLAFISMCGALIYLIWDVWIGRRKR